MVLPDKQILEPENINIMEFKSTKWQAIFFIVLMAFFTAMPTAKAIDMPTDREISLAIEKKLLLNASTPSFLIDVTTSNGIATLSGEVNNLLAQDRAVKVASMVKGVRAVINKIEINTPYRSDATLKEEISSAILEDPATDMYEIDVTVLDSRVTLNGTVDSWQEKQLAGFVVKGVKGVKNLYNNLGVEYATSRNDFEIETDVEQTMNNDVRIDDGLIKVEVADGNVTLTGTVGSANEKYLAIAQAWVMGVSSVAGKNLEVENWARDKNLRKNKYSEKTDQEVELAVQAAFLQDPRVYAFNPEVEINDGVVTLTGQVSNLKAKRAAEQDARNVVGVNAVNNHLKVRPVFVPENDKLKSKVQNALNDDPVTEKWEINVKVDQGLVYLHGLVNSRFERKQAEEVASRIKGVINVKNNVEVADMNNYQYSNYYGWNSYYPPYFVQADDDFKSDSEIKSTIESQLWWSPYVNQDDVEVTVDSGMAILTGTVETKREKLFAEINALEGGAQTVDNNLIVMYMPDN